MRYIGQSQFVRWWPEVAVVIAVALLAAGPVAGAFSLFAVAVAGIWAYVMPWRFVVVDDGIALWFPFGRRRFLAREEVTVRVNRGGAVAYRAKEERGLGIPLTDGLVEKRRMLLRAVLVEHGFRVV